MKSGQVRKQHYEYEKHDSCALLAAIEPLTGKRAARVFDQRRKREYALFLQELAALFPAAEKIRLVQDNLNTHNASSLYETFTAEEAFGLANRFEFYYTPKKASRRGSDRDRIFCRRAAMLESANCDKGRTQTRSVSKIVKEREEQAIRIEWQFSIEAARSKLNRHYEAVQAENKKYKIT